MPGQKLTNELPNARVKFTFQNLMPGQKLTPELPNARAKVDP